MPPIDPLTQYLSGEPTLAEGKTWKGPIIVPNDQLGFQEQMQRNRAGIYYKQKVTGFYPGDGAASRINIENMPYSQYIIVGKVRAGGFFMVLGGRTNALDFATDFNQGTHSDAAGHDFSFIGESVNKGLVLMSFSGMPATPPPDWEGSGGSGGSGTDKNQTEIITFTDAETVEIDWNSTRINKFGSFPLIEVWFLTDGVLQLANTPITCDAIPPDTTLITVNNAGPATGFVVIK